jgi:hypothetical protein
MNESLSLLDSVGMEEILLPHVRFFFLCLERSGPEVEGDS